MKVLTPEQMGAVDRATIEAGIPAIILMENAAHRCVEYLAEKFAPLSEQRIVVVCGKGNNGGDGLAIARQLHVRFAPRDLWVVVTSDAAQDLAMLHACGVQEYRDFGPEMRTATLVIDAVLGTGLRGAARGPALEAIREINRSFPFAKIFSVDIPSGLAGDTGAIPGEYVRADAAVTFTALKVCHAMPPACGLMGDLRLAQIGSPASLYEHVTLERIAPEDFQGLFAPRPRNSNKGLYGHVLVVAGARGKSGAAAMAGLAALRAGAGLATVACPESALAAIAAHAPEVMTEPLPETSQGVLAKTALSRIEELASTRTVVAVGPGIGTHDETREVILALFASLPKPMVVDADALNCLAAGEWHGGDNLRILTPHPGEMKRLMNSDIGDRMTAAQSFAAARNVHLVLKGDGTLIASPDGRVSINPTGSPAMSTGGTGDILTGMIAGLVAQHPRSPGLATEAAVYLHGLAGEIAARELTEQCVIATDLLRYLPGAIRAVTNFSHQH